MQSKNNPIQQIQHTWRSDPGWAHNKSATRQCQEKKGPIDWKHDSKQDQVHKDTTKHNTEDEGAFSEIESRFNIKSNCNTGGQN